jgi:molybdopterin converting factor small subunit
LTRFQTLVFELPVADPRMADDIDTPDDFRLWQERLPGGLSSERGLIRPQEVAVGAKSHVQVPVRFFALAKDRAGRSTIDVELASGSRVKDLREEIARLMPGLAPLMPNVLIAVNEEYADDDACILPGARVAVIPPVSGGAGRMLAQGQVERDRRGLFSP